MSVTEANMAAQARMDLAYILAEVYGPDTGEVAEEKARRRIVRSWATKAASEVNRAILSGHSVAYATNPFDGSRVRFAAPRWSQEPLSRLWLSWLRFKFRRGWNVKAINGKKAPV